MPLFMLQSTNNAVHKQTKNPQPLFFQQHIVNLGRSLMFFFLITTLNLTITSAQVNGPICDNYTNITGGGYLLVAEACLAKAAGYAAFFWEAMKILSPEIAACWMERLPEQCSINKQRNHSFWADDRNLSLVKKRICGKQV
jgi:hypothetical protein